MANKKKYTKRFSSDIDKAIGKKNYQSEILSTYFGEPSWDYNVMPADPTFIGANAGLYPSTRPDYEWPNNLKEDKPFYDQLSDSSKNNTDTDSWNFLSSEKSRKKPISSVLPFKIGDPEEQITRDIRANTANKLSDLSILPGTSDDIRFQSTFNPNSFGANYTNFSRGAGARSGLMNNPEAAHAAYKNKLALREKMEDQFGDQAEAAEARNKLPSIEAEIDNLTKQKEALETKKEQLLTLKRYEMSSDPEWEIAKNDYLMNGDRSGMDNIMSRIQTVKGQEFQAAESEKTRQFNQTENTANRLSNEQIAKMNKEKESEDKTEANVRNAKWALRNLRDAYLNYEAVKNDPDKRVRAATDLLNRYNEFTDASEVAKMDTNDLLKGDERFLEQVNAAIEASRLIQSQDIDKTNADNKKRAETKTEKDAILSAFAAIDADMTLDEADKMKKKKELANKHANNPKFIVKSDGTVTERK